MGLLLNTLSPAVLYEEMAKSTYFVDKTAFIGQMLQRIGTNGKYVLRARAALAKPLWPICWEHF